jgi:hypothetical protein
MVDELGARRYRGGKWVRIHDAGGFYSDDYLRAWLSIARVTPDVTFYAYTREVNRFRRIVEPDCPPNFLYLFSLGGREDHLVDRDVDRHCDVFPDRSSALAAGYTPQTGDDRDSVRLLTNKVAVVANNIPQLRRKQGVATFGQLQAARGDRGAPEPAPVALRLPGI